VKVDNTGNVSVDTPAGGIHVDSSTGAVTTTGSNGSVSVNSNKRNLSAGNPIPARAGAAAAAQQQAEAVPAGPSPEEIAKVEDDADKLNVRAAAVTHSVDTLRQQQSNAGYNLRPDIAASAERMQMYLAKGNAALGAHDLKNANKYFDLADAELSKLEKFLGH
jgi:hypothetical protein